MMLGAMKVSFLFPVAIGAALAFAQDAPRKGAPVVYINGEGGTHYGAGSVAKHDETMEMARLLLKSCSEVSITLKDDAVPDYSLLLNRGEEHWGSAVSQVMVLRPDKSVMFASKQGTVARAVRDGCKAITADWKERKPRQITAFPDSTVNR